VRAGIPNLPECVGERGGRSERPLVGLVLVAKLFDHLLCGEKLRLSECGREDVGSRLCILDIVSAGRCRHDVMGIQQIGIMVELGLRCGRGEHHLLPRLLDALKKFARPWKWLHLFQELRFERFPMHLAERPLGLLVGIRQ